MISEMFLSENENSKLPAGHFKKLSKEEIADGSEFTSTEVKKEQSSASGILRLGSTFSLNSLSLP